MQKRAEGGGSGVARPDEKMGNTRDNPWWGTGKLKTHVSSAQRKVIKRIAAKKRRQRDKLDQST